MPAIKFSPDKKEEGLRVIIHAGTVEYTSQRGVYLVPNHVLTILKTKGIPYEIVPGVEGVLIK